MGSILHGSARTTPRVRAELQASEDSARTLATRHQLIPKTVLEWRHRSTTRDAPMGSRHVHSAALTPLEELEGAAIVEFRGRTLLPLDDVLGCLREQLSQLSRSARHRCLQRHGISRLPPSLEHASKRGRFAETRIGYVHIDACEVRSAEGKLHLFLAIDRVSNLTCVELHPRATMLTGAAFLRGVIKAFPYAIHTILTDNGVAFADSPHYRHGVTAQLSGHAFDRMCRLHGITHKTTRPYHPRPNGQTERMHRTIKDATLRLFHYATAADLKAHIAAFVTAYNFAQHLKALRWRTPYQAICDAWRTDRRVFKLNPHPSSRDRTPSC
jgi:transposase InsO family protein